MAELFSKSEAATDVSLSASDNEAQPAPRAYNKPKCYRSTIYNAIILGVCNFLAPAIWGAMNSLGAGGEEKPYLVNAANALTFCLMVVSCFFGPVSVKAVGIRWTLIFGTLGYAPFAAAIALSYPEPYNQGKFLGLWLSFRVGGQVLGGAINLGLNANNSHAGKVSHNAYLAFIALSPRSLRWPTS